MQEKISGGEEYDHLLAPVRKLCKFITIWPFDLADVGGDEMKLYRARQWQIYHRVFIFCYMLTLTVTQIADAVRKWGKMKEFTECCLTAASYILAIFRLFIYSLHQENIIILLDKMREDWVSASNEERAILRKKCLPAFMISKSFIVCISLTMSLCFVSPMLLGFLSESDEWLLPYGGYFYIDVTKTPTYQILYIAEVIGGIYGLINVATMNSLNFISTIHASANFLILQRNLSSLKRNDERSVVLLRLYIQRHQKAIRFADLLEEIMNKMALGQFIVSAGLVCFAGLQISEMVDNKLHLLKYAIYLASAIFELFLFSYSGYQLTLESELVGDSAFNSDWVGSSLTQNLNIIMMRASRPNKITAAKFYDMSLESFSMVLRVSFSYFTALRAVNEE